VKKLSSRTWNLGSLSGCGIAAAAACSRIRDR
jgi:hypothetical protein